MELLRSRVSKTTAKSFDLLKLLGSLKAPTNILAIVEGESTIAKDASLQDSVSSSVASIPNSSFASINGTNLPNSANSLTINRGIDSKSKNRE
jgi:hypothetical protein